MCVCMRIAYDIVKCHFLIEQKRKQPSAVVAGLVTPVLLRCWRSVICLLVLFVTVFPPERTDVVGEAEKSRRP